MKAKTFWMARDGCQGSTVRVYTKKPVRHGVGGTRAFRVARQVGFALCARGFKQLTGITIKQGDGPYRVTMTLRKER